MHERHKATASLLVVLFLCQDLGSQLLAQSAPLTQQQLDQLLSPVALYPDHRRLAGEPALGVERMGLELESPARLLQQCGLGRVGQAISSAAPVVSSTADHLDKPSGIRRQLALPSAELQATAARQSPRIRKASVRPGQSSGLPAIGESPGADT